MFASKFKILIITLFALTAGAYSQTYDLRFVLVQNEGFVGGNFDVLVQIKSNGSTFGLGTSNLAFDFNDNGLSSPTLLSVSNFSGGLYNDITVTEPASGRASVNIELFVPNNGTVVPTTYINVATVRFSIDNTSETSNLVWRTSAPNATNVFDDDLTTLISSNDLQGTDVSLPVSLSGFSLEMDAGAVALSWITQSETNNAGFEVYRSIDPEGDFEKIGGYEEFASLESPGNTSSEHSYQFIDANITGQTTYWYKLADVDLNGFRSFHNPKSITTGNLLPDEFALEPNYPNPFNPETTILFQVPGQRESAMPELVRVRTDSAANLCGGYGPQCR